jgi:hypothetical protein
MEKHPPYPLQDVAQMVQQMNQVAMRSALER